MICNIPCSKMTIRRFILCPLQPRGPHSKSSRGNASMGKSLIPTHPLKNTNKKNPQTIVNKFAFFSSHGSETMHVSYPDLNCWSSSSTQPVPIGTEAQSVDLLSSIQCVQMLALIQIPQHGFTILKITSTNQNTSETVCGNESESELCI